MNYPRLMTTVFLAMASAFTILAMEREELAIERLEAQLARKICETEVARLEAALAKKKRQDAAQAKQKAKADMLMQEELKKQNDAAMTELKAKEEAAQEQMAFMEAQARERKLKLQAEKAFRRKESADAITHETSQPLKFVKNEPEVISEDIGKHLFPAIRKMGNNLYSTRIADKNLTLVMERIDSRTKPLWLSYINLQSNPRVARHASAYLKGRGNTRDGSLAFQDVLEQISCTHNEIWVAYITKAKTACVIPDSMRNYTVDDIENKSNAFTKDIEMFITVTSNPDALITSHMGIAASAESSGNRTRGTSLDLQSFAAKVMIMRNPKRRYMVNAPVFPMEKIITDALPHSVFVGTREMREIMTERLKISFEEFKAEAGQAILEKLNQHEANSPIMKEAVIQEYIEFINPYYFDVSLEGFDASREASWSQDFLKFMEIHPPLLSVGSEQGNKIWDCFTLFDSKNPSAEWLTVNKEDKSYQWMFTRSFRPKGFTHYIVVDLHDLAHSRPII